MMSQPYAQQHKYYAFVSPSKGYDTMVNITQDHLNHGTNDDIELELNTYIIGINDRNKLHNGKYIIQHNLANNINDDLIINSNSNSNSNIAHEHRLTLVKFTDISNIINTINTGNESNKSNESNESNESNKSNKSNESNKSSNTRHETLSLSDISDGIHKKDTTSDNTPDNTNLNYELIARDVISSSTTITARDEYDDYGNYIPRPQKSINILFSGDNSSSRSTQNYIMKETIKSIITNIIKYYF